MSILSRAMQAFAPSASAIASGPSPAAIQNGLDLAKVLDEFREQRAEDFAQLADRAGRSGAKLAEAEEQCERWRDYAQKLERLCLEHGIAMPPAPDEDDR